MPQNSDRLHAVVDADGWNVFLHKPVLAVSLDERALPNSGATCGQD